MHGIAWYLAIGASIALISQTYNIHGDLVNFLLIWVVLAAPVMYLSKSSMSFFLYLGGIIWWASMAQNDGRHAAWFWLLLAAAVFLLSAVAMNARDGDELKVHGSLVQFQDVRAQTKEFMDTYRSERWTPSFGQVFGSAQVESGFMVQVALLDTSRGMQ